MAEMLAEFDELSAMLGVQGDDLAATSDGRPATGGTSASASTAAPSGSKAGSYGDAEEIVSKEGSQDLRVALKGGPRLQRDLQQCRLPLGCRLEASQASPAQLFFTVDIAEGPYTPATIVFWIKVFEDYPALGSFSVRATKKLFHPCVDPATGGVEVPAERLQGDGGEIQLRTLLLAIREIIVAPPDSVGIADEYTGNPQAAALHQSDREEFRRIVRLTLNGGEHGGTTFGRILNPSGRSAEKDRDAASSFPVSDKVRTDMMQLESMKEKFKAQATEWQQHYIGYMESLD